MTPLPSKQWKNSKIALGMSTGMGKMQNIFLKGEKVLYTRAIILNTTCNWMSRAGRTAYHSFLKPWLQLIVPNASCPVRSKGKGHLASASSQTNKGCLKAGLSPFQVDPPGHSHQPEKKQLQGVSSSIPDIEISLENQGDFNFFHQPRSMLMVAMLFLSKYERSDHNWIWCPVYIMFWHPQTNLLPLPFPCYSLPCASCLFRPQF